LKLPGTPGASFKVANNHHRATIRWAVNRAIRSGVRVRPATTEADLAQWYKLYLDVMRSNVAPPRPLRFFAALTELLRPKGMMELLLAEQHITGKTRIVAGAIFLRLGQRVSYAFSGSRTRDRSLQSNDLIQWEAINEACRTGVRSFDFGEVPEGRLGLTAFKSKWGAEPVRLCRYYHPAPPQAVAAGNEQTRSCSRAFLEGVWRHLPPSAIEWLGGQVYSYL
jgi:hypothetical protein